MSKPFLAGGAPTAHDAWHETLAKMARSESHAGNNARACQRCPVQAPMSLGIELRPGEYRPLYFAWATDASLQGLGILMEHELPSGMELVANLEVLAAQPCLLRVRVIYCQRLLPHTFRLGLVITADAPAI